MEAILKYNLDNYDEKMAHLRAIKSLDLALVVWEFYYNARRVIEDSDPKTANDAINKCFGVFVGMLESNNIIIDELVD